VIVPVKFRPNVIAGLALYAWAVFGLAKTSFAFGLGKALPMLGYAMPARGLGGLTTIPFLIMLIVALLPFRKATAGANPAGKATVRSWLLQGAWLFLVLGIIAAGIETIFFLGTVLPILEPSFGPEARGTVGSALTVLLYVAAAWISYVWAKRRVDAR